MASLDTQSLEMQRPSLRAVRGYGSDISSLLGCEPEEAHRVERMGFTTSYRSGDVVAASITGRPFYSIVLHGAARACLIMPSGRRYTTGLAVRGQLIPPIRRSDDNVIRTVEATLDMVLCCIPAELFQRLLRENGRIGAALQRLLAQALDSNSGWMSLLGRRTVAEKIAAFLLLLMERAPEGARQGDRALIEIPLSRSQLAEFLGISSESISRGLTSLKQARIIRFRDMRTIEILQAERLAGRAGESEPAHEVPSSEDSAVPVRPFA